VTDLLLVALVAAFASALTLVSGFGLGTLLLPAFALFLPVPTAVAATAIVHLLNNLLKSSLLQDRADWRTVLAFGLPAVPAAVLGGWLLGEAKAPEVMVGGLLILFGVLELMPWFQRLKAPAWAMPLGGALTGLLGGLTGQQGALRSIFLLRARMAPDRFVATGAMIALLIDLSRLGAYAGTLSLPRGREWLLVGVGAAAALGASFLLVRRIEKVTIEAVRTSVAALLLILGAAMALGWLGSRG
jgi:uncharacterized protein